MNVDSVSHWMATNNARDNLKKRDYFERFGIADGLRRLAEDFPFRPRTQAGAVTSQPQRSYCMNRKLIFIAGLALALPSVAAVAQEASARTVQYHSQDIVPIHAKLKYTTLIEVPPTEKIMEAATGDKDFWIVDVVGNFCFVHPAKAGISSNLNLITDKGNIYSFTLQDVSGTFRRAGPEGIDRACRPLLHRRGQRPSAVRSRRATGAEPSSSLPRCNRTSSRPWMSTRAPTRCS